MMPRRYCHAPMLALALALLALASPAGPPQTGSVAGKVAILDKGGVARKSAAGVVIWVGGAASSGDPSARARRKQMESHNKSFIPRVLAVRAGDEVDFPNSDAIFHNVFSVSGQNRFDLGLYRRGTSRPKKFSSTGLVRVYCNIHPQMVGYIHVFDSDLYAVTREDGTFTIAAVPAGARTLHAWHEEGSEVVQTVSVAPGRTATVGFTLDASGYKPFPHKNKYGKDYPPPPPDDERY